METFQLKRKKRFFLCCYDFFKALSFLSIRCIDYEFLFSAKAALSRHFDRNVSRLITIYHSY